MTRRGAGRRLVSTLGKVALATLGVGVALGMAELLLRTFPNWVPREVRVSPPVRRVHAYIDETYAVRLSDGDLFHWMRGAIAPLVQDQDRVVAWVHLVTDANGFRNLPPERATYDIVALGDSFTRASGVATPWPQELAASTGMYVLNLADVGAGPQQELEFLRQFGINKHPQWVIMAYFGANDLYEAGAYEKANPFILPRFGRFLLTRGGAGWPETTSTGTQVVAEPGYRYPITMPIDGTGMEMAFFSPHISWLSVSGQLIEASQDYRLVREVILAAGELSEEVNSRLLLVYIPSKEHVYLPYLDDAETARRVYANVSTLALDEAGFLQFTNLPATLELTLEHMDDQANLLAGFAAAHDVAFLDLTSTFQEVAGTGVELYYPFDTHWNQQGHYLAAEIIAGYLQATDGERPSG
ncbi:MAG: hypothetical protein WD906_06735 [Anaerolineales bacterium]